ncbi:2-oxoacid:acceptor oxidoreductase family protein [Candidatus Desantisbacteria bacterium]|nr:2-oxoacid:acceptor oxidoreductase family protein [Candidatus Desantisbacteria bacterium]
MIEVRWHGRGGQGVVTAAKILCETALAAGKYIQAFPEYGAERMGAPIQAFSRISSNPIHLHCKVINPSMVIVLDPTLLKIINITEGMTDDGILIINTPKTPKEIREKIKLSGKKIFTVDAIQISIDTIGRPIPNTPMLGALVKATNILELDSLLEDFKSKYSSVFSSKIVEKNLAAIKKAYQEVKSE